MTEEEKALIDDIENQLTHVRKIIELADKHFGFTSPNETNNPDNDVYAN